MTNHIISQQILFLHNLSQEDVAQILPFDELIIAAILYRRIRPNSA